MRLSSLLILSLAACGGAAPTAIPLEKQVFDPSLGVDLAASTRTADGAYYRDVVVGTGNVAVSGGTLIVDYVGYFPDGTQFGSSQATGTTFTFVLGASQVIPGWEEGLPGARAGGTRQLIIPAALAYGNQKRGNIPPNSNLVFTIVIREASGQVPVEKDVFAPALNVNLAASTRTANGVYFRDTAAGNGAPAAAGQTLVVDYVGFLADGTKFDASQDHQSTFTFKLGAGQVIAGWDEGLLGVKPGATRQLVIPSALAYGANPSGYGNVPPYANLVFIVKVYSAQ